jgi:hypothetical protein
VLLGLARARVAQEDRVIEVEHQLPRGGAQQGELPAGQQEALQHDGGAAQLVEEAQPRPPAARQAAQAEGMSRLLQRRAEGSQTIAAANVVGAVNQGNQLHDGPP